MCGFQPSVPGCNSDIFPGNGFRHGYCTGTPPGKSIRLHGHHHCRRCSGNEPLRSSSETFVVNGVLGYEAQLVNAVISTRGPLTGRIEYDWFGPWEKIIGKFEIRRTTRGKNIVYLAGSWPMKTGSEFASRQHYAERASHAYWSYFWRRPDT
ncbi:putative enterohemolysin [Escherichia coli]|uniref:Putative enterohemolysin n=1 Tax=Escherichia coli TaxID=562 RepID=A0A377A2C7_ECOLX|nr:putative enterohemolysin [Escherichia coli]